MDLTDYRQLRSQARRLLRNEQDAEDLVQETLVAALEADRSDMAWLSGVMRKQSAMMARSGVRRRRREAEIAVLSMNELGIEVSAPSAVLNKLPPAARRVAMLALHGLSAGEIRWILGLTPAAFRQRLTSIRRGLSALSPEQRADSLGLAYLRDPARVVDLQFGLVRRVLKVALLGGQGLGTHDTDGHLLVIRGGAHTSPLGGN